MFFIRSFLVLCGLVVGSFAFAQANAQPPCLIQNIRVGYVIGQDIASIESLVSKVPKEQLTPLAKPSPLRPLPIEYLNPKHQKYYRNIGRTEYLIEEAAINAMTMVGKANQQGIKIWIHSAYRSYEQQCDVFRNKVAGELKKGMKLDAAIKFVNSRSAFPGESEHQLGTTIDIVNDNPQLDFGLKFEFARSSAYQWLQENAVVYGFVLSYPAPETGGSYAPHPKTQIVFEPWHWRYIGPRIALLYKTCQAKMTVQEYLREFKKNSNYHCL